MKLKGRVERLKMTAAQAAADPDGARARRDVVLRFEGWLRGVVGNLEGAIASERATPDATFVDHSAEPTVGGLLAFLRAESAALDGFDKGDMRTLSLVFIWNRTFDDLRTALGAPPRSTTWPCPAAWLELQLYRLAWKGPDRVLDNAEYNRLCRILWERREAERPPA